MQHHKYHLIRLGGQILGGGDLQGSPQAEADATRFTAPIRSHNTQFQVISTHKLHVGRTRTAHAIRKSNMYVRFPPPRRRRRCGPQETDCTTFGRAKHQNHIHTRTATYTLETCRGIACHGAQNPKHEGTPLPNAQNFPTSEPGLLTACCAVGGVRFPCRKHFSYMTPSHIRSVGSNFPL